MLSVFCLFVCFCFVFPCAKQECITVFLDKNKVRRTKVSYSTIGQRWLLGPAAAVVAAVVVAVNGDGYGSRQLQNCHCSENTRTRPATAREEVAVEAGADVAAGVDDELRDEVTVAVVAGDDDVGQLMGVAERLESAPRSAMHIHCSSTSRWV